MSAGARPGGGERLQKVLARAGVASRRAAEDLIRDGRVRVDGRVVTELGTRVDRRARVEVDSRRIVAEDFVYLVLHKPRGVMCTLKDPEGRPTVRELVDGVGARVVPVGRLDFHTSGVLLMTNDGDFAAALAHPRNRVPKVYVAKVQGIVDERGLERWKKSIDIDGKATQPAQVSLLRNEGGKTWLQLVLHEGKNRQVRRLGEEAGFPVMRLVRTEYAGITTEGLRPGQWRELGVDELTELKRAFGVPRRVRPPEGIASREPTRPTRQPTRPTRQPTRPTRQPTRPTHQPTRPTQGKSRSEAGSRQPTRKVHRGR